MLHFAGRSKLGYVSERDTNKYSIETQSRQYTAT